MMKRKIEVILVMFYVLFAFASYAQIPENFNYQATLRNADKELMINQDVNLRISLLQGSETGPSVYTETHAVATNTYGLVNLKIGQGTDPSSDFSMIDWNENNYFLAIEIMDAAGSGYISLGASELQSVPYSIYSNNSINSLYSDTSEIARALDNKILYFSDSDTLFAVKDRDGNIVFAVFPDGAKIYVDEKGTKGSVGGFAVSGRGTGKAFEYDVFRVTPDSARFYLNEQAKGMPGGFAVSGRGTGKSVVKDYFNISSQSSAEVIDPSEPRILWYPKKEAFLVGRVLVENPDSVGINSVSTGFESKAIGDWSQAFGYQAVARSNYSTAIGKNATSNADNSFAFGNMALALKDNSYAIGSGAVALGVNSFALGSVGIDTLGNLQDSPIALGDNSFALGLGSRSTGLGSFSMGINNIASGDFSTAIGFGSIASGARSIAIGPYTTTAGYGSSAIGYRCKTLASGGFGFAAGVGSETNGYAAMALGAYCEALGSRSVAMGDGSITEGFASFAVGKDAKALAANDYAMGIYVTANGGGSFAFGKYCSTDSKEGSVVFNTVYGKNTLTPSRNYQMNFKAENGFRFFNTADTSEVSGIVVFEPGGNVGIGLKKPAYKLDVVGDINTTGDYLVNAKKKNFADYVFSEDYELESIEEHAAWMWKNKHLPALRSAEELSNTSYSITERSEQMLEELEKAHIYIEQLNDEMKKIQNKNQFMQNKLEQQQEQINLLINEMKQLKK